MTQKLTHALDATKFQKSTQIQKVFNQVKDADDYRATFEVSSTVGGSAAQGTLNPAGPAGADSQQRELWAQELQKA